MKALLQRLFKPKPKPRDVLVETLRRRIAHLEAESTLNENALKNARRDLDRANDETRKAKDLVTRYRAVSDRVLYALQGAFAAAIDEDDPEYKTPYVSLRREDAEKIDTRLRRITEGGGGE